MFTLLRYLLKSSFIHGSSASSSSELFFSPKQSGNDNLKSFPPGIRFVATSSLSIKCPHLKKELFTVVHAESYHSVVRVTRWHIVMAQHGSQRSFACGVRDSFIDCRAARELSTEFSSSR